MKKTLTVGISAFNEAETITPLLEQLLAQKSKNYRLDRILIVSDGSTDATPAVVSDFIKKHPHGKVELIADPVNKGRAARLKQIYTLNQSDIVVIFDGDLHIPDQSLLDKLAESFCDSAVGLVSTNNQPIRPNTFVGDIWWAAENFWYEVRKDHNKGDNLYNNSGCGVALERKFAKKVHLPPDTIADHQFIYISAMLQKRKFVYRDDAVVYYQPPATLKDILNQYRRSLSEDSFFSKHFDDSLKVHFEMPGSQKRKGLYASLKKNPVLTLLSILLLKALPLFPLRVDPLAEKGLWQRTDSTKTLKKNN